MAQTWTATRGIGNYGSQIRTVVTLLSQNRAGNTSRVRVVVSIYNGGRSRSWDSSVGMAITGTVSASATGVVDVAGYSWQTIMSREFTIGHGSDGRKSFTINGVLGSTGTSTFGSGGTATVSGSLPQLLLAPLAPVNLLANRVTDSAQRLTWGNRSSARAPYTRLQVQRLARSTGKWQYVSTSIGAGAQSHQDSGTRANDRYDYRVRAVNSVGVSPWARNTNGSSDVSTTPAAPASVTAEKSGSSITVSWTDRAANVYQARTFVIEDSPNGGAWVQVGTVGASTTYWTHASPNAAQTHRYRVRARITDKGNTLTSGYSSASETVQLSAPPKAPTQLDPPDGSFLSMLDGGVTLAWNHNPVDTTRQEAAQVQYRIDGGAWQTDSIGGPIQDLYVQLQGDLSGRQQMEWQVRTRGTHSSYGPWSPIWTVTRSSNPFATVNSPAEGQVLEESRLSVAWTYDPVGSAPELAQHGWRATLLDLGGNTIEVQAGDGDTAAVTFEYRLENRTGYVAQVEVRNGDGIWSAAEDGQVTFSTNFPLPALVETFPTWDRDEAVVNLAFGDMGEARAEYEWTGTPWASPSRMLRDGEEAARNLVPNPLGPDVPHVNEWRVTAADPVELVMDEGRLVMSCSQGETGSSIYMDPAPNFTPAVGATIRWAVDVKVLQRVDQMRLTISTYNGADRNYHSEASYVPQLPEDGWVRYQQEATVTAMPDGGYLRCLLWPNGTHIAAGDTILVRNASVILNAPEDVDYFDGDTPSITDVDGLDVERNDGDGWVRIASAIPVSTTITDRTPRLGEVRYRAVSRTALPTERTGPEAVAAWVHDHDPVYVSGGDGWSTTCTARGADASDKPSVEQELQQFAGSPLPVAFFGEARSYETTFSGRIWQHPLYPVSTREEWTALLYEAGIVCFRDCRGRKVFGLLAVDFSTSGPSESVSISVQQARHTEGVPRVSDVELENRIAAGG